jgi:hypothetical protein
MKVKFFAVTNVQDLEKIVNGFLDSLTDPASEVKEIKFSTDEMYYSVMIILND